MRIPVLGVALALCLAGCSTSAQGPRGPLTYAAAPMTPSNDREVIQFDLIRLLDPSRQSQDIESAFLSFATLPLPVQRRNEVVGVLLMASDRNCDIYMENLRGAQSGWRTGFSLSSIAFGTAGSIFTDAATTRILSGLSGASSGASGKLDEGILGGMGAEVVLTSVRAARAPFRDRILSRLTDDYTKWPISVALADVMQYHGRCNVVSGLSAAQRAVETIATPSTATAPPPPPPPT